MKKMIFRLVRRLSREKLDGLLKDCSDPRLYQRLLFVSHLYDGDSVPVAASKVRIARHSAYVWAFRWNKAYVDGLLNLPRSGTPSKLTEGQKE